MAVTILVEDHTVNSLREASISESVEVTRLVPELISKLHLPIAYSIGHSIVYRSIIYELSHEKRHLQDNETLTSAGVQLSLYKHQGHKFAC